MKKIGRIALYILGGILLFTAGYVGVGVWYTTQQIENEQVNINANTAVSKQTLRNIVSAALLSTQQTEENIETPKLLGCEQHWSISTYYDNNNHRYVNSTCRLDKAMEKCECGVRYEEGPNEGKTFYTNDASISNLNSKSVDEIVWRDGSTGMVVKLPIGGRGQKQYNKYKQEITK